MVKFDQLNLDQLKRELIKYKLSTSGNEAELRERLMEEFERQGLDVDSHEFEGKDESELSTRPMAGGMELRAMFAAMMEQMAAMKMEQMVAMKTELQEAFRKNSEQMMAGIETKLLETSRRNSEMITTQIQKAFRKTSENMMKTNLMLDEWKTKLQEASRESSEKTGGMKTELQEASRENSEQMMAEMETDNEKLRETMMVDLETEFQEASRTNNEELRETIMTDSKTELQEASRKNSEQFDEMKTELQEKREEISGSTYEKLHEISASVNNRIDNVESTFDKKLVDLENVDKMVDELEAKDNNLQQQEGDMRVVQETSGRIKIPTFDGGLPFGVFKFQFETVAQKSLWGSDQKVVELILAWKCRAAVFLEIVPASSRNHRENSQCRPRSPPPRQATRKRKRWRLLLLFLERAILQPNPPLMPLRNQVACKAEAKGSVNDVRRIHVDYREDWSVAKKSVKMNSFATKLEWLATKWRTSVVERKILMGIWYFHTTGSEKQECSPDCKPIGMDRTRSSIMVCRIWKHESPRSKMRVAHLERLAAYGRREIVPIRDE